MSCELTYGLRQSTAPTAEPVDAQDVQSSGLMPDGFVIESAKLQQWCKSARKLCETFTQRQFITASWEMTLDRFPSWEIRLPRPPWISITSVVYLDTAGDSQTVSSSDYRFETVRGRLTPAYNTTWPSTYAVSNAVTITYQSGYGANKSLVPDGIRAAIEATVLDWAENRRMLFKLSAGVEQMLMEFWTGKWSMLAS